jgi:hypothetical protein
VKGRRHFPFLSMGLIAAIAGMQTQTADVEPRPLTEKEQRAKTAADLEAIRKAEEKRKRKAAKKAVAA